MTKWPAGVDVCNLIPPTPVASAGGGGIDTYVTIEMLTPGTGWLIWSETGAMVLPVVENLLNPKKIAVPVVDQEGWLDQALAPFTALSYRVTVQYWRKGASEPFVGPYTLEVEPRSGESKLLLAQSPSRPAAAAEPTIYRIGAA